MEPSLTYEIAMLFLGTFCHTCDCVPIVGAPDDVDALACAQELQTIVTTKSQKSQSLSSLVFSPSKQCPQSLPLHETD